MRVPQVSERIKEAPAQALRGVFAGIGQVLLIADRLRNKTPASQHVPPVRAPEPPETRADPAMRAAPAPQAAPTPAAPAAPVAPVAPVGPVGPAAERVAEVRDLDKTGNVRLLTSEEAGAAGTAPSHRCGPGCATSTQPRSSSWPSTRGRTPPVPTSSPCSSVGSPSWRPAISGP